MKGKVGDISGADNPAFVDDGGGLEKAKKEEEATKVEPPPAKNFFELFRYSDTLDKCLMILGVVATVVAGATIPFQNMIFGGLTDAMIEREFAHINQTNDENTTKKFYDAVDEFAVNNSLLGLSQLILGFASIVAFNHSAERQVRRIRLLFLRSVLRQDIGWYDKNSTGDFASRMAEDLNKFEEGVGEKVVMYLYFMSAFFGGVTMALVKGWKLALICLASLPVMAVTMLVVTKLATKFSKNELESYAKAGAIAEEVFSSVRTVVACGGQEKEMRRYGENLVLAKDNNIKRQFFNALGFGLLFFFIYGMYALSFWSGINMVLDGDYTAGQMTTVFFSVMVGGMYFGMSAPYLETFSSAMAAAGKIFAVIDRDPPIDSSSEEGLKPEAVEGEIEFRNVRFSYPSRPDVQVLEDISLKVKKGQTVAFVGSSGCGKSTCIQLIQRFYDPAEGQVTMDGVDIRLLNVKHLRQQIGVVGQEPVLFAASIADNIRYSNEGATMGEVIRVAKMANAHDFISHLPQGYDTLVGERGAQLSGGQKQRVAIARALLRSPSILLLDEATSALDTASEAKVQVALDNASQGRTTIIVAHRLSTIRQADRIVVFSKGRVIEEGTHGTLMSLKGEYFQLVTTQMGAADRDECRDGEELEDSPTARNNRVRFLSTTSDHSIQTDDNVKLFKEEVADDEDAPRCKSPVLDILKLNSPEWKYILLGTAASLASGFCPPVFSTVFGDIMGVFNKDKEEALEVTKTFCMYFLAIGIVMGVSTFVHIWAYGVAGEILAMRVRALMFGAMIKQEMAWFDRKTNGVGALCTRLSTDASHIQGATGQRIGTIVQSVGTLSLALVLSLSFEWRVGLVALAFTPFLMGTTFVALKMTLGHTRGNQKALEKSSKIAVESIGNIRTVAGLGREKAIADEFTEELKSSERGALINNIFRGLTMGLSRSIAHFAYVGCLYYGSRLIETEDVPFQDVFKVTQALLMGSFSVANALAFAPNFQKGINAAEKMFRLLKRVPKIRDVVDDDGSESWEAKGNVTYNEVKFRYPLRPEVKVLRGLNLAVAEGKTVALVGHSGCGKSTVVQLLLRFYDPNEGDLQLDDRRLQALKLATLRNQLGLVSQEPVLFDRTIAENIAYGDNSREVPMDEIISAAEQANIHSFIASLPAGYETTLGEKGAQLSGGQKQRIAIARALIRKPKVLLLDEATSALDTQSEKAVQEALDKASANRTCITIAHRLSTIQNADVIVVINKGKIAETGTHAELLDKKGLYRQLYVLQSGSR